jgi:hypothetical protein
MVYPCQLNGGAGILSRKGGYNTPPIVIHTTFTGNIQHNAEYNYHIDVGWLAHSLGFSLMMVVVGYRRSQ